MSIVTSLTARTSFGADSNPPPTGKCFVAPLIARIGGVSGLAGAISDTAECPLGISGDAATVAR